MKYCFIDSKYFQSGLFLVLFILTLLENMNAQESEHFTYSSNDSIIVNPLTYMSLHSSIMTTSEEYLSSSDININTQISQFLTESN